MKAGSDDSSNPPAAMLAATEPCCDPVVHPSLCLSSHIGANDATPLHAARGTANWRPALRLLRPQQWSKNLLLFVPLAIAHRWAGVSPLFAAGMAFIAFCCCASAIYIFNDLMDLEADRRHPEKHRRPLAAGDVPLGAAVRLFVLLLSLSFAISLAVLPLAATGMLFLYLGLTIAYSLFLKKKPIVDVFLLAGLYTIRIFVGGIAVRVAISGWLMAFSIFFFLSLALVKRYSELLLATRAQQRYLDHRGYLVEDIGLIQSLGPASGYMAVLTFCLYINTPNVLLLYRRPDLLWGVSLVLFFWITRIWFLAQRRRLKEDPVAFAMRDPASYVAGLAVLMILLLAAKL